MLLGSVVHQLRQLRGLVDSATIEATLMAGRQLIQFLGFNIDYPDDKEGRPTLIKDTEYHNYKRCCEKYTDEVKITDLGGSFLKLESLTDAEKSILVEFCHGASKSTAHLTEGSGHKLDLVFCPGCDLILRLD